MNIREMTEEEAKNLRPEDFMKVTSKLLAVIKSQQDQIENLKAIIALRNQEKFSPSSEQLEFLFDEAEVLTQGLLNGGEPEQTVSVAEHQRKKRKSQQISSLPANTPVVDIDHTAGAVGQFEQDEVLYVRDGERVIDKIAVVPRTFVVERHHYAGYRAAVASGERNTSDRTVAFANGKTDPLAAAPSLVAQVAVAKYDDHLPLYRQQEMFLRDGVHLSRQKLAGWIIAYYEMLLPLQELLKREVYGSAFLNKDETRVMVLDVQGPTGKPAANSYMNITIGTSWDDGQRKERRLVLVEYIQGRSREVLLEDLHKTGFEGGVMTDGLAAYLGIEGRRHCVCWVHAVRKMKAILKSEPKGRKDRNVMDLVALVAGLYAVEDKWRGKLVQGEIDRKGFLEGRKGEALEKIAAIYAQADEMRSLYSPSGVVGAALQYLYTYRPYLPNYLDFVEATPDNNCCERVAKSFATGRKCWLFSKCVDGADASAFFLSLVETAKCSGISPSDYLEYVCTYGPECRSRTDWERLLPWNVELSKVLDARAKRVAARPDPDRSEAYHLTGATR